MVYMYGTCMGCETVQQAWESTAGAVLPEKTRSQMYWAKLRAGTNANATHTNAAIRKTHACHSELCDEGEYQDPCHPHDLAEERLRAGAKTYARSHEPRTKMAAVLHDACRLAARRPLVVGTWRVAHEHDLEMVETETAHSGVQSVLWVSL